MYTNNKICLGVIKAIGWFEDWIFNNKSFLNQKNFLLFLIHFVFPFSPKISFRVKTYSFQFKIFFSFPSSVQHQRVKESQILSTNLFSTIWMDLKMDCVGQHAILFMIKPVWSILSTHRIGFYYFIFKSEKLFEMKIQKILNY